jgi:hypothetical protein
MIKMGKNIFLPIIIFFVISFFKPTFGQVTKSLNKAYVGTYKTEDQKVCPITLTLSTGKDGYHYKITIKSKVKEGPVKITKQGSEVYFQFKGLYQKKPKKDEVEAQYIDNTVVIQNDGNAMNKFTVFGECNDDKYIELKKIGRK